MRIAFLTTTSLDSPYGLGRCFPFAHQLAAMGHDVHIVALHHDLTPAVARHFALQGVSIHYVGQMHVRKQNDSTTYYPLLRLLWVLFSGWWGMMVQSIRLRADIYHIGKPHPQNSVAGFIAARFGRHPLFLDYDDLEVEINRTSNAWQRRVLGWLENNVPRWVDGVTVHSQFLADRLVGMGLSNAQILRLPSCVARDRFQPVAADLLAQWRMRLGIGEQQVILYVGTLSLNNHPVDLLLHAFAQLLKQRRDVILLLVGGGADWVALQKLAEQLGITDRCRFAGRVAANEVPALFGLADVSVDPIEDNLVARARWPLKIIESLAAGVPVITGDVGDRRAMLGNGRAGLLVDPGDAAALAAAIQTILADPSLHAQLKAGALTQAQLYSPLPLTTRLLEFYTAACSST